MVGRQARALLVLPGNVLGVIPALILHFTGGFQVRVGWHLALAAPLAVAGGALMVKTMALFAGPGEGTPAPWDPPRRLVVAGPYRFVRHPMITGVLTVLLAEAILFRSWPVAVWWLIFLAANAFYLPLVEEPGLVRRFGADYERYRRHVPRIVPRLTPWSGGDRDG